MLQFNDEDTLDFRELRARTGIGELLYTARLVVWDGAGGISHDPFSVESLVSFRGARTENRDVGEERREREREGGGGGERRRERERK